MWNLSLILIQIVAILIITFFSLRIGREMLITWIALQTLFANLFVLKQICIFSFHVTCSDAFALGCVLGLNLMQEYFGKEAARKALWISFCAMGVFAAFARLHLLFHPSPWDTTQSAYWALLSPSPRLLCASVGAFLTAEWLDIHVFSILRNKYARLPLWVRNGGSQLLSQWFDTALFTLIGLWGIATHLGHIMVFSYGVKCGMILFMAPLLAFTQRLFKWFRFV